ncbi:hypothetical protein MRX96_053502 [Rhipicephalus microplus]
MARMYTQLTSFGQRRCGDQRSRRLVGRRLREESAPVTYDSTGSRLFSAQRTEKTVVIHRRHVLFTLAIPVRQDLEASTPSGRDMRRENEEHRETLKPRLLDCYTQKKPRRSMVIWRSPEHRAR